jgi:hypothetical protein
MQPMPGGNLLHWIRLDPSVEEKSSEDDKAVVCWWMHCTLVRMGMDNKMLTMWPCVVRPYLDPSLSTRPAGTVRVDGPATRARADASKAACSRYSQRGQDQLRVHLRILSVQAHSGPSWTPDRLLLTDHRRHVAGTRPPADRLPGSPGKRTLRLPGEPSGKRQVPEGSAVSEPCLLSMPFSKRKPVIQFCLGLLLHASMDTESP